MRWRRCIGDAEIVARPGGSCRQSSGGAGASPELCVSLQCEVYTVGEAHGGSSVQPGDKLNRNRMLGEGRGGSRGRGDQTMQCSGVGCGALCSSS